MPQKSRLLPVVRRMVVALGALDLLAQEQPGRLRGERHRAELEVGQDVVDGAVLLVGAGRGDQLMDDLVPGPIGAELLAQPVVQRGAVDHPALVAPADQEDRPLGREVLGEVGMIEQVLDQLAALVGLPGGQEGPGLLHGRDPAEQVEVGPPQELLVGRRLRRLDARRGPGLGDPECGMKICARLSKHPLISKYSTSIVSKWSKMSGCSRSLKFSLKIRFIR